MLKSSGHNHTESWWSSETPSSAKQDAQTSAFPQVTAQWMENKVFFSDINKKHSAGDEHQKDIVKNQANAYLVIFCSLLHFLQLKAVIFFS